MGLDAESIVRASMYAFQKPSNAESGISAEDPRIAHSNILTYTGIDKREGLVTIAKRLLRSEQTLFSSYFLD